MLGTCVFLSLVLCVNAVPRRCCADHQFEATMGEFGGTILPGAAPSPLQGYNLMSYDYYSKMLRLESHMLNTDGSTTVTDVIIDYKAGKQYIKSSDGCVVMDTMEKMTKPCVPAQAVYQGNSTFGYGDSTLTIDRWRYTTPGTDNVVTLGVTVDGCIPFAQTQYGTMNNATTDVVYFISGFHPGISNRGVFAIPRSCSPAGSALGIVGRAVRAVKNLYSAL